MNEIMVRIRFSTPISSAGRKGCGRSTFWKIRKQLPIFTLSGLAHETGSSDASIVRFCKKMGYSGYTEFKQAFLSAANEESSERPEKIEAQDDMVTILKKVISQQYADTDRYIVIGNTKLRKSIKRYGKCKIYSFFRRWRRLCSVSADGYENQPNGY